ncbi:hypothetical protein ACTZVH_27045 [Klebsiella pneumoniae]|uniref:hypothetical protein n=1 Tax=Klebsiella TaxID=570 RepID=UPI001CD6CAFA|nr:hypothetical protein [Klebsiella pneumoniae]MCS6662429.1 hypothetical protein [Klebsiella pneumoniae subsp. pneumoniae]MCS6672814.1 hypothetical protein [Klebsiella pneumoniae subsp. pneumoniae]MEE2439986.1 hypothetical protein [Klebsiella pneumoniae]HBR3571315.1 hypothetical protein [Klebsiella pneumoniae]HBR7538688.1 hypothetical protein [Klebsiella pneumoniae]
MTTDITELTQSLKAAATNVKETAHIARYLKATIARQTFKELMTPDNILALVEALEKAQAKADVYDMLRDDYGLREKGVGLVDFVDWQAKRIADLESRTVKLPDDEDGQAYGFGKWANRKLPATAGTMTIAYCEDAWRAAFEVFSSAAGIKVEAE